MKYLKEYKLFENLEDHIKSICEKYNINHYSQNNDGSIDVHESVKLRDLKLSRIPLNFNEIDGYFDISGNNLTSLEGLPKNIKGFLSLEFNNLISLKGIPNRNRDIFRRE
jgi:hypothetical protein